MFRLSRRKLSLCALVLASLVCTAASAQSVDAPQVYVLKAARMFDGASDTIVQPGVLVISGNKIQSVGGPAPAGARVIDLGDATLLPGFIDAHTHEGGMFEPDYSQQILQTLQRTPAEEAIRATENVRKTLLAGFTSVRDLGESDFVDVGLRNSINAGVIPGPRMMIAAIPIGSTGGHADPTSGYRQDIFHHESAPEDGIVNSPEQARYAVRLAAKYGADVIKVMATGGVLSLGDKVDSPQMTQEELNAIVSEAHDLGLKAAAHAHGAEGAKRAVRAGISSIEHGTFLDDEALRMMKDKGVYLVPTLTTRLGLKMSKFPPNVQAKAERAVQEQDSMVKRALAIGVKIALGTDAAVYPHGMNAKEFELLVADGMTPAQALRAGTSVAADLLGTSDRVGHLKQGYLADVVAVPGNPLQDITLTQKVNFVMKDGVVYRNDATK